jgi:hypothetical protein
MGRRELLIALAFVVVGIVAYQFGAPPTKTGQGFSLARFFTAARQKIQSDRAQASFTLRGTIPVSPSLAEVRVARITGGVTITGEARSDIAYELKIDSTGPDEPTALSYAKRTTLTTDDLGSALALGADYPSEGSQVAELTLRVPMRLSARLDNAQSSHVRITHIAGVRFDGTSGDAVVEGLSGAVTGQLRTGSFSVTGASTIDMTLQGVNATIEGVTHDVTLTVRAGRCTLSHVTGAIEIDATNTEVVVTEPVGPVHVGASGGHVSVTRPQHAIDLEGRRTGLDVTLGVAVSMTLLTTDEPLTLRFGAAPPPITIDASASDGGSIHADDPRLTITSGDRTQRLTHDFGGSSAPRVVMRNQRGEIVIGMAK